MRKPAKPLALLAASTLAALVTQAGARAAKPVGQPEREALELARVLKPIPDDEWKSIAGDRAAEKYSIARGDTLFDISKRLFGDARYWPKIWALNNDSITNPHIIRPGKQIAFLPGTGTSLPAVSIGELNGPRTAEKAVFPEIGEPAELGHAARFRQGRSSEWKELPRQAWENIQIALPAEVDPLGFDRRTKISFPTVSDFDLESLVGSDPLESVGRITAASSESMFLGLRDAVYIQAPAGLQIGESYAISREPNTLRSGDTGRTGYSHLLIGKVKIVGVRDQLFSGIILSAKAPILRGDRLLPLPGRAKLMDPVPGPSQLEGTLLHDHALATYASSQHKQVFVDRGSDDGVQPGMIFRAYQHTDPGSQEEITESNYLVEGDVQITQVSPQFSTGVVIHARGILEEGQRVTLLTDVSDLKKSRVIEKRLEGGATDEELEELEKLESGGGLGKKEERELRQLEKYKETPPPAPAPEEPAEATGDAVFEPAPEEATPAEPTPEEPAAPETATPPTPSSEEPVAPPPPDSSALFEETPPEAATPETTEPEAPAPETAPAPEAPAPEETPAPPAEEESAPTAVF